MFDAEDRMRQATDVSLLNQLVLEVYLAAWTRAGVEHEQALRPVAASSDDVDGEIAVDVIDLDHFIGATWGLDVGGHGGETAERRWLSTRGQPRRLQADPPARLRSLRDHPRRLGRRRDVQRRVCSVCYTNPYLMDRSANSWKGDFCVAV